MSNPVFNAMGGGAQGGPMNMMNQFQRFMNEMKGKNPNEELNRLLQSGRISQQQLNQAQQMAQQMRGMFQGFLK